MYLACKIVLPIIASLWYRYKVNARQSKKLNSEECNYKVCLTDQKEKLITFNDKVKCARLTKEFCSCTHALLINGHLA